MEHQNNNYGRLDLDRNIFVLLKSPSILLVEVFILAIVSFWLVNQYFFRYQTNQNIEINTEIIKKNETLTKLTAYLIKTHLDNLMIIGSFYAKKNEVVRLMQKQKWQEAQDIVASAIKDDKSIDRIALFDMAGVTRANMPVQKQLIGQNFAYRDWYRGVIANFKPYVSEVYVRATEPKANVVGLAFPVKDNNEVPVGIILFTIKLDTFLAWLKQLKFGNTGITFIVDKRGYIIAHPDILPQAVIVDYSSQKDVQKAISGQSGSEVIIDSKNGQILSSYEPILSYHWGVITRIRIDELTSAGLILLKPY